MLAESERRTLLSIARCSIDSAVRDTPFAFPETLPPMLMQPLGAFVTLRIEHELRGCIGYVDPVKPLCETVREAAAKAALQDVRFPSVSAEELPVIRIEISVLSPLKRVHDIDEIEIGIHGLVIETGNYRGLLLPQVALEHGWDRQLFLDQTARKAGLPPGAWRHPGANILVFTAEIIAEESRALDHHDS